MQDGGDAGNLAECDALWDIITSVVVHHDLAKRGDVILDIPERLNALVIVFMVNRLTNAK